MWLLAMSITSAAAELHLRSHLEAINNYILTTVLVSCEKNLEDLDRHILWKALLVGMRDLKSLQKLSFRTVKH